MKALLLAAGFATRMHPLTLTRAKPLLEIGGRPMLTHLVDRLSSIRDIDEFVVVGNGKFAADFEAWRNKVACDRPVRVLNDGSTDDSDKLGAIGDIAFALERVPGDHDWLVVAGDNLFEFDPLPFHELFREHGDPLLLLREIECAGQKSRYNEVKIDEAGVVTSFREKPPDPQSNLVAICFYFLPPALRGWIARYLAEGNNPDAPGYFIQWLARQTRVRATRFHGPWFDIGNLQTLEEARARYGGPAEE